MLSGGLLIKRRQKSFIKTIEPQSVKPDASDKNESFSFLRIVLKTSFNVGFNLTKSVASSRPWIGFSFTYKYSTIATKSPGIQGNKGDLQQIFR